MAWNSFDLTATCRPSVVVNDGIYPSGVNAMDPACSSDSLRQVERFRGDAVRDRSRPPTGPVPVRAFWYRRQASMPRLRKDARVPMPFLYFLPAVAYH